MHPLELTNAWHSKFVVSIGPPQRLASSAQHAPPASVLPKGQAEVSGSMGAGRGRRSDFYAWHVGAVGRYSTGPVEFVAAGVAQFPTSALASADVRWAAVDSPVLLTPSIGVEYFQGLAHGQWTPNAALATGYRFRLLEFSLTSRYGYRAFMLHEVTFTPALRFQWQNIVLGAGVDVPWDPATGRTDWFPFLSGGGTFELFREEPYPK